MKKRIFKLLCLLLSILMMLSAMPFTVLAEVEIIEEEAVEENFMTFEAGCPRCDSSISPFCSGQTHTYVFSQCAYTMTGHPVNCQVKKEYRYTGQICSKFPTQCEWFSVGSDSHWCKYTHTMGVWGDGNVCPF